MNFRLVRYFSLTSLLFFVATGSALGVYYREMALSRMLRQQESSHVNLTRIFANTLWTSQFSSLLEQARDTPSPKLKELSQIPEIHQAVLAMMRGSSTYKIKVYDTGGRTIYSSETAQIGEDKSNNPGFLGALAGHTRTELVHKEKFSAFEQVVENRDLIQSYIPRYRDGTTQPEGVFEIYSDVTPLLVNMRETETRLAILVVGAMAALFAILFVIVRRAEHIIQQQAESNRTTQQQLAQAEKMSSLGQLVAGVSHQLNTPIAFSHSNVSLVIEALKGIELQLKAATELALSPDNHQEGERSPRTGTALSATFSEICPAQPEDLHNMRLMLGDVLAGLEQMRELVQNLRDFTRLDSSKIVETNLNEMLQTVVYIARSAIPSRVSIVEQYDERLPSIACNPSQLNQVFLNLITNAVQAIPDAGKVRITTYRHEDRLLVDIVDSGTGIAEEILPKIFETYFTTKPKGIGTGLGLPIARDIVRSHGGEITVSSQPGQGTTFTVSLPLEAGDATETL